uniref:H4MPT-linked C1 transfer pathway protein n=1 Tax=Acidicaldus sp. TaxID=1872105 RepID=A0A8J4HA37_9PROT
MGAIIGWDLGGAHLKAARVENGKVTAVLQLPAPLWQGLEHLAAALDAALARLGPASRHAATMTGELADIFPDRATGVRRLSALLAAHLAPAPLMLYAGAAGFVPVNAAEAHAETIASGNWHATARLAARAAPEALLADCGSTTTDLIPLHRGAVAATGSSDAARLAAGELVYTGFTRSFVMALAPRVPFAGGWTPLACEHFATSADLYRILGELNEDADQMPTADGREKTVSASIARLARMIGRDVAMADAAAWRGLAAYLAEAQLRLIHDAALQVLSRLSLPPDAPVIGAGVGRALVLRLAERLHRPYRDLFTISSHADHASAVAVGLLL